MTPGWTQSLNANQELARFSITWKAPDRAEIFYNINLAVSRVRLLFIWLANHHKWPVNAGGEVPVIVRAYLPGGSPISAQGLP